MFNFKNGRNIYIYLILKCNFLISVRVFEKTLYSNQNVNNLNGI